jgi:hypothetical protein
MFVILDNIKKDLDKEIKVVEDEWGADPKRDYLFHMICGIKKAIEIVEKSRDKELLELDKWAQGEMRKLDRRDGLSD